MKRETGIIMSGNHPKLILDGTKTMTRRTWGLNEINKHPDIWKYQGLNNFGNHLFYPIGDYPDEFDGVVKCPYGQVGQRLWVRESYGYLIDSTVAYRANCDPWHLKYGLTIKWKPSIHMFRKDSRITLEITDIRVERLQEITPADACAEGMRGCYSHLPNVHAPALFRVLWDFLNAKRGYSWDSNPWVWVLSFKRIKT